MRPAHGWKTMESRPSRGLERGKSPAPCGENRCSRKRIPMKFKYVHSLNEDQKPRLTRILGVRNKFPMAFAILQGTSHWNILKGVNDAPLDAEKRLKCVATYSNVEDVISSFQKMQLIPYCPEKDIIHDNPRKEKTHAEHKREVLHRRHQLRKNVSLAGKVVNERTKNDYEALVDDLSFDGAGFYTIGDSFIRKKDILYLDFTLNNKQQSRIKRRLEVKHVSGKKVGGEFLYKPRLDADLGFYLLFDVQ